MIRVTVELVPYGEEEVKHVIGELILYNTGENSFQQPLHDYKAAMKTKGRDNTVYKSSVVEFDRNQDVFALLQRILNERQPITPKDIDLIVSERFIHCK